MYVSYGCCKYSGNTYKLIRTANFIYAICEKLLSGFKIIVFLHTLQLILQKFNISILNNLG